MADGLPVTRRRRRPVAVAVVVLAAGVFLTALSTYATARVDHNTERRLLQTQTRQAGAVLQAAITLIERPLTSALDIQRPTPGDPAAFRTSMSPYVGTEGQTFVSASLWKRTGSRIVLIASLGVPPAMPAAATATKAHVLRAFSTPAFTVLSTEADEGTRIVYTEAGSGSDFAVYAERSVPADRRTPSDRNSAFADLHYATYLGSRVEPSALATTDLPLSALPIKDDSYRMALPFGDTELTLVTTARRHLGGDLSERLPLILLGGGLLLSALASFLIFQVARGRQAAETDAATITSLYQRLDSQYGEQRHVSERLQRALLPPSNPDIPGIEVASDYVAGARGVDIGGDWFSIIALGDEEFAFVVGDVSGRGIDAVAVMARVRFTLRAYLVDGDPPDAALEKASPQFDISADGHLTTVLVGIGNSVTGRITLANAGHPPPLLISAEGAEYVRAPIGPPLGTGLGKYPTTTMVLAPGATLVAYTDGLVERRGEDLDLSLDRLRTTARELAGMSARHAAWAPLDGFVTSLLDSMKHDGTDDVAVLALRRPPATGDVPRPGPHPKSH